MNDTTKFRKLSYLHISLAFSLLCSGCSLSQDHQTDTGPQQSTTTIKVSTTLSRAGFFSPLQLDNRPSVQYKEEIRMDSMKDIGRSFSLNDGLPLHLTYLFRLFIDENGNVVDTELMSANTQLLTDEIRVKLFRWKLEVGFVKGEKVRYYIDVPIELIVNRNTENAKTIPK